MSYKDKEAERAFQKEYYKNNKETLVKRAAVSNKETKKRNREYIAEYLNNHPCVDCEESDPIVLEFDHVRGIKRNDISKMVQQSCSIRTIQDEIEKCEVRCANCHRRVTHKRRNIGVA